MQLLVRPEPYVDESLESYLLRLSTANFLESYQLLSGSVRQWLWDNDYEASGAFPLELAKINVCYAKQSSSFRIRALKLMETLTDMERLPLLKLALLHSSARFCNGYSAVFRDGVDTPLCFLRRDGIPVCPMCLSEAVYVRQQWHWLTYQACTKHQCKLVDRCPSCDRTVDYLRNEILEKCPCGYDLTKAPMEELELSDLQLSRISSNEPFESDNPLLQASSQSLRNGVLLWYYLRNQGCLNADKLVDPLVLAQAIGYFENWPASLHSEMEDVAQKASQRLVKEFNKTGFQHIFGDLLLEASRLPVGDLMQNFVLAAIVEFLAELAHQNPKTKRPNIADLLLTVPEAVVLLGASQEQVYRLYQEGYLELAFRPPLHHKLSAHTPAFYLRQVVELRQTRMQSDLSLANVYLPAR